MKTSSPHLPNDLLEGFITELLPENTCLQVIHTEMTSEEVTLVVTSTQPEGHCPLCGDPTSRVHSRYERMLQDLPFSGRRVRLILHVRRFFCANMSCPRQIFAERLPALAEAFARRTNRLRDTLLNIGWANGGEAGARLCQKLAMPVCAATLLAQLRRAGVEELPTPRVLGVDDWGFQQHPSGTILVDLEQHRPVDILPGSDEEGLTTWLHDHPGVEVIARDRGAGYRKASTKGVPHALQVLDRWHVLKNLGEVVQKTLAQQIDVLRQAGQQVKKQAQQPSLTPTESLPSGGKLRKPHGGSSLLPVPDVPGRWRCINRCMNWLLRGKRKPKSSTVCTFIRIPCANICACQHLWHTTVVPIPLSSNPTGPTWRSAGNKGQ